MPFDISTQIRRPAQKHSAKCPDQLSLTSVSGSNAFELPGPSGQEEVGHMKDNFQMAPASFDPGNVANYDWPGCANRALNSNSADCYGIISASWPNLQQVYWSS